MLLKAEAPAPWALVQISPKIEKSIHPVIAVLPVEKTALKLLNTSRQFHKINPKNLLTVLITVDRLYLIATSCGSF